VTFWIIILAMAVLVVFWLVAAMRRVKALPVGDAADFDVQVYRDQLTEVERDVARGVVPAEDATRIRTEISRRILVADSAAVTDMDPSDSSPPQTVMIWVLALVLIGGSIMLYRTLGAPGYGDMALADRIIFAEELRKNRPDQATAVASLPPNIANQNITTDFTTLMEKLRETVAERPDDLQGHQLLAQNEARIGNFTQAADAQEQVLRLKDDALRAEDITDYAELLILAAGGYVSPKAEAALRTALVEDDQEGRARYYIGLMMVQTGRPDIAFRIWDTLLRRGPETASWMPPIRAQIMTVAALSGVNYTMPAIGTGSGAGPSLEDIEAASEMTTEERMEMIGGMVDGLSNRLATEGGPPEDWARLITSLAIMGNPDQALAIFNNAMQVFGENPGARDIIVAAGSQAGVAEE
jgi:cytochrome c-type biogenesis protein CcmH